jgi:hypothetical protein
MMTIIFFVSFIGLVGIIGSKIFEIKVRKIDFISRAFFKGDEKIHQFIGFAFQKYNLYKKIARLFVFEFLPAYAYEVLVKLKDYVAKKYYSHTDGIRGRRVLKSNGSVSSFLERLGDKGVDSVNHKV